MQNLGENLPIHCHSERSEESQKKNNRESSPTAQNDNFKDFAESSLDSANPTNETNSSIVDEFLGNSVKLKLEASNENRTLSPSRKRADALPKKSPQDEFELDSANFGKNILNLPCNLRV